MENKKVYGNCDKLTDIKSYAFHNVTFSNQIIDLPQSITNINSFAFQGHSAKEIKIYRSCTNIGSFASLAGTKQPI